MGSLGKTVENSLFGEYSAQFEQFINLYLKSDVCWIQQEWFQLQKQNPQGISLQGKDPLAEVIKEIFSVIKLAKIVKKTFYKTSIYDYRGSGRAFNTTKSIQCNFARLNPQISMVSHFEFFVNYFIVFITLLTILSYFNILLNSLQGLFQFMLCIWPKD